MRVIVCGGRNYTDRDVVFNALDRLHAKHGIDFLIQGAAAGADYLAWQWAQARGVPCGSFPADWKRHGRAAGPLRNRAMIVEGKPDAVVAFPGERGTANMLDQARAAGLKIWEPVRQTRGEKI